MFREFTWHRYNIFTQYKMSEDNEQTSHTPKEEKMCLEVCHHDNTRECDRKVAETPIEEEMKVNVTTQLENLVVTLDSAELSLNTHAESTATVHSFDGWCRMEDCDGNDSEDSDSDSFSSSSSSSSSAPSAPVFDDDDHDEGFSQTAPIKTRDEVLLEELPAEEQMFVSLPKDAELQPVGTVSSIINQLVVIQSLNDIPPLTDESIIFTSDRLAVGKVFEVFGPVSSPLYILRFNSVEQISSKGLTVGLTVYYAPAIKEYTGYILTQQLKLFKGSDASWKNDQEPPEEALDYSDDEKEHEAKRRVKNSKRTRDNNNADNPANVPHDNLQEHDIKGFSSRRARPPFKRQNPRNKQPPPRHTHMPPVYLPPPCPYLPPPAIHLPPPSFHLFPPPSFLNPSFSNPSFSSPFWPPSFPDFPPSSFPPPPPPPTQ